jgi:hypothetical protein
MEKLIDIIRNKNINLHGLHPYISTVGGRGANLEKYIFLEFLELLFNGGT